MAHILKLTVRMQRGDDTLAWGFRMAGGVDYNMPLCVQKVMPGSMAEEVGLLPGDLITAVGDPPQPAMHWSHQQAQNAIRCCGNYLVMTVQRGGSGSGTQSPISMPTGAFTGSAQQQHQQQQQPGYHQQSTSSSYQQQTRSMLNDAAQNISQTLSPPPPSGGYASSSPTPYGDVQISGARSPQPLSQPSGQQAFINVQYENGVPVGVQSDLRTRQNPNFPAGSQYDGHNRAAKPFNAAARPFGAPTTGRPPSGGGGGYQAQPAFYGGQQQQQQRTMYQ